MTIDQQYDALCSTPSDIWEHLPTLKKYAEQSESIVELGVRYIVSTWAFLAGKPKSLLSVDIQHPKDFGADIWAVYDAAREAGIDFDFVLKSSLEIDLPVHDFLFIDTLHTYDQLRQELDRHHSKVKKFIAMHDTNLDGDTGMQQAITEFLKEHPEWEVLEEFKNNNGLTVLHRI
jgi:cephalosporin hydroxylase